MFVNVDIDANGPNEADTCAFTLPDSDSDKVSDLEDIAVHFYGTQIKFGCGIGQCEHSVPFCITTDTMLFVSFTLPDWDSDSKGFPFGYNCYVLNVYIA